MLVVLHVSVSFGNKGGMVMVGSVHRIFLANSRSPQTGLHLVSATADGLVIAQLLVDSGAEIDALDDNVCSFYS